MDELDEIRSRLNIVEYVGRSVSLTKTGRNYKGLCPFHHEKTPSFIVSEEKQIFHCFGCNEGGDVFEFAMKTEGLDFPEAVRKLAEEAGVILQGRTIGQSDRKQKLYEINDKAASYFEDLLQKAEGREALQYLRQRGLTLGTIRQFRLGYAPQESERLVKRLQKEGFSETALEEAGVASRRGNVLTDQFRDRITFPIQNASGQVLGFSARVLGDRLPKYINTPATRIYDKSQVLYGINLAKEAIRKKDYAIIVEGNMDVIASHQAGITNVVASSGTALTERQLDLLKRFTRNLKLAFDLDPAGNAATRRAISLALEKEMNLKVIEITEGKDAAEVLAKNPKIWLKAIRDAKYYVDYLFEKIFWEVSDHDILRKKKATKEFLEIIRGIKEPVEKDHYVKKLANRLGVTEETISTSLKTQIVKIEEHHPIRLKENNLRSKIEERLLGAAILNKNYLEFLLTSLTSAELESEKVINLYKRLESHYNQHKLFDLKDFEKLLTPEENKGFQGILLKTEDELEKFDEETTGEEIFYLIRKIKKFNLEKKRIILDQEISTAEKKQEQAEIEMLMRKKDELIKEEQEL